MIRGRLSYNVISGKLLQNKSCTGEEHENIQVIQQHKFRTGVLVGGTGLALAAFAEGVGMGLQGSPRCEMDMGIDGLVYHQDSHDQDQHSCYQTFKRMAESYAHSNAKEVNR